MIDGNSFKGIFPGTDALVRMKHGGGMFDVQLSKRVRMRQRFRMHVKQRRSDLRIAHACVKTRVATNLLEEGCRG